MFWPAIALRKAFRSANLCAQPLLRTGVVLIALFGLFPGSHFADKPRNSVASGTQKSVESFIEPETRQVYRYSVVSGGVYNPEELKRAIRTDNVVARHYRNFADSPRFYRTERDLLVYVSYRKQDSIYWTKARHRVPKGETVLTDGANLARARCGNQLSLTPQQPVEDAPGPDEDVLSEVQTPQLPTIKELQPPEVLPSDAYISDSMVPVQPPAYNPVVQPSQPIGFTSAGIPAVGPGGIAYPRAVSGSSSPATGSTTSSTPPATVMNSPNVVSANPNSPIQSADTPLPVTSTTPDVPVSTPEPSYSWLTWMAGLGVISYGKRLTNRLN